MLYSRKSFQTFCFIRVQCTWCSRRCVSSSKIYKAFGHRCVSIHFFWCFIHFTFLNAFECWKYCSEVRKNVPTLNDLISEHVVSKGMANKIAGSGLNFSCLKLAYTRNPHGIYNLLSEKVRNNIRVTKSQRVIHSLNKYFATLREI